MQDIMTQISQLKRPDLLVRAARFGIDEYSRTRHLPRFINVDPMPSPGQALVGLFDYERSVNADRLARRGGYDAGHHIQVLVAIMAESQLYQETRKPKLTVVPRAAT